VAKASGPIEAAMSHQTISSVPTIRALPVIRVRIEVKDVHWGR
jgi:hypothetical protein